MKLRLSLLNFITLMSVALLAFLPIQVVSQTTIKMEKKNGVYYIPCSVNGLGLQFVFDTGAGDVSISMSEAVFMLKNGYLKEEDLIGTEKYRIANGDIAEGTKINIRELKIGDRVLYNVEASIVHTLTAPLLLGGSAIKQFGIVTIDYKQNVLYLGSNNSTNIVSTQVYSNNLNIPDYVPREGLIGWWPFNGNTIDASGNGHDCTNYGCQLISDRFGKSNSAYHFITEKYMNYMEVNNSSDLIFNELTINLWYKSSNNERETYLVCKGGPAPQGFSVGLEGYVRPNFECWDNQVHQILYCKPPLKYNYNYYPECQENDLDTANWHMLTVTLKNGIQKMYIDGSLYKSTTNIRLNISNKAPITFGCVWYSSKAYFTNNTNFRMDDISIYNRALTNEEVVKIYNGK